MNKPFNINEKIVVATSIVFLIISWVYVIANYNALPNEIVAHMDLKGNVNRYDSKKIIWVLLGIFTALSGLLYWFATNTNLNNENSNRISLLLSLPYLSIICLLLCNLMINKTLNHNYSSNLFLYLFIGLTILLVVFSIILSLKNKK